MRSGLLFVSRLYGLSDGFSETVCGRAGSPIDGPLLRRALIRLGLYMESEQSECQQV